MPVFDLPPEKELEFIREISVGFSEYRQDPALHEVDELLKAGWQLVSVLPRTYQRHSESIPKFYSVYMMLHPDKASQTTARI